jgi:REP element-mobilizing transposase RayT
MCAIDVMELHSAGETHRPRFDYQGKHRYLVTMAAFQKHAVFSDERRCRAVLDVMRDVSMVAGFEVVAYVFVPDELTLFVRGYRDDSNLKSFMATLRSTSSAALEPVIGHPLWKRTYRERVLRKTELTQDVARQVFFIPVQRGLTTTPERYPMLGSFVISVRRLLESKHPARAAHPRAQSSRQPSSSRRNHSRPPRRPKAR